MRLNRMIIRASDDGEGGNRVEKMTAADRSNHSPAAAPQRAPCA